MWQCMTDFGFVWLVFSSQQKFLIRVKYLGYIHALIQTDTDGHQEDLTSRWTEKWRAWQVVLCFDLRWRKAFIPDAAWYGMAQHRNTCHGCTFPHLCEVQNCCRVFLLLEKKVDWLMDERLFIVSVTCFHTEHRQPYAFSIRGRPSVCGMNIALLWLADATENALNT